MLPSPLEEESEMLEALVRHFDEFVAEEEQGKHDGELVDGLAQNVAPHGSEKCEIKQLLSLV